MNLNKYTKTLASAAIFVGGAVSANAQSQAEAADKAFRMAAKYAAEQFRITPAREGMTGAGSTLRFSMPVNIGLDYVFIVAGDKNAKDVDVWIQSETGNTIVKDTRKIDNGLCGVRWRSDFNGTANVVVHFARATSLCGWSAVIGRRGTVSFPDEQQGDIVPPKDPALLPGKKNEAEGS